MFDAGDPAPPSFDGIVVLSAGADGVVAGIPLPERAAFCLARGGARRLMFVGRRPAGRLRLPELPASWSADTTTLASWLREAAPALVVLDAATVTTPATISRLAAVPAPDGLRAAAPARLWRTTPPALLAALPAECPTDLQPPALPVWQPAPGTLAYATSDAASRRHAEDALFGTLGRAGDGWFTRVVDRRFSRAITRRLAPLPISPNQVTVISLTIGILGGLCFALGTPTAALLGALLFLASTIIDGCDGELARLTFRETRLGAQLDVAGDNIVHFFLFGGIALGLYRQSGDPGIALLGVALLMGVVLAMLTVYLCMLRRRPSPAQRRLFETFASREFAYLLVILTVSGHLDWFLWMAALGIYAFAGGLLLLGWRSAANAVR